jgi:hypothetical protein
MQVRVLIPKFANLLNDMATKAGITTQEGQALHKCAGILAKAVPPESVPEGGGDAQFQRMAQQDRQNQANVAAMRQSGGAGGAAPMPRPPNMPGAPGGVPMAA